MGVGSTTMRAVAAGGALALALSGCAWISRTSVSDTGAPADAETPTFSRPAISADGRYVAFDSFAGNLSANAEDGGVFVRDTRAGTIEPVSVRADGTVDDFADTPAINGDGRYVAFVSDGGGLVVGGNDNFSQVFVRDRVARTTTRVSSKVNGNQGTDDSDEPSISRDGRFIAFQSDSPGLVVGDTNDATDVFVRDRVAGTTRRISVDSAGTELENGGDHPSIDASGSVVAFVTSEDLVPADTNQWDDVYVRNLATNGLALVSAAAGGRAADAASWSPEVSADGRSVTFTSTATNLDGITDGNGALDVFVRDLATATTVRASRSTSGTFSHGQANHPTISGDGRFVSFDSTASDLVAGDTNGATDAFVFDRTTGSIARLSTDQLGGQLPLGGDDATLSADGISVTFRSASPIPGQSPSDFAQLYVRATVPSAAPR